MKIKKPGIRGNVLALLVLIWAPRLPAGGADATERILFSSLRPGNWEIYALAAGGALQPLTNHPGLDYDPVLSPDGRWVVFTSERGGNPDLYALDLQHPGTPQRLIDSPAMEDQAAFSPDGKLLAFVGSASGNADIYLIAFDPRRTQPWSAAVNLTRHPGGDFRPAFSPDGRRIAFSSDRDALPNGPAVIRRRQGEIYLMNIDGTDLQRLTYSEIDTRSPSPFDSSPGWDGSPAWSADGRHIYFYSGRQGGFRIWRMQADGSGQHPLSPPDRPAFSPTETPGGRIAYHTRIDSTWQIVSVNPDGTDERIEAAAGHHLWGVKYAAGAAVCYGPGQNGNQLAPSERSILGPGPLFSADYPATVFLPDRCVELLAVRDFTAVLRPDGTGLARLNTLRDSDFNPVASNDLIVSALDLSRADTLYRRPGGAINAPAWSRDGRWLCFMQGDAFGPPAAEADVWTIRADGTGAVNLTPDSPGNDGFAEFSGDRRRIVFRSGRTGNFDIFLINADGSAPRNLTADPATDTFPAFSPTANLIVFCSNRDGEPDPYSGYRTFELYLLQLTEAGLPGPLRRLTDSPGQDAHPRFSPDGRWVVFTSERGGINDEEPLVQSLIFAPQMYGEIYALRLADGAVVRLTHNKWEDGFPSWGAAGRGAASGSK